MIMSKLKYDARIVENEGGQGFLVMEGEIQDFEEFMFGKAEWEERHRWHINDNKEITLNFVEPNIILGYN